MTAVDGSLASFLPREPILPHVGGFGEWDDSPKSPQSGQIAPVLVAIRSVYTPMSLFCTTGATAAQAGVRGSMRSKCPPVASSTTVTSSPAATAASA